MLRAINSSQSKCSPLTSRATAKLFISHKTGARRPALYAHLMGAEPVASHADLIVWRPHVLPRSVPLHPHHHVQPCVASPSSALSLQQPTLRNYCAAYGVCDTTCSVHHEALPKQRAPYNVPRAHDRIVRCSAESDQALTTVGSPASTHSGIRGTLCALGTLRCKLAGGPMGWPLAQVHVRSPPSLTTVVAHDYVTLEVLPDSPASAAYTVSSMAALL